MFKDNKIRFRRQILHLMLLVVVGVFLSGCIGKKPKVYRVGILSGAEPFASIADGFKAKMTELGYIEGKNIIYDFQKLNADPAGEQQVVKKFVADKVDLIFAFPTDPAVAAKVATQGTNVPVVFALGGIEGTNLVESVSHPGGNITGVRYPGPELTAKRFEFLHELVPNAKRVYLIYDRNYPNTPFAVGALHPIASSSGITLVEDPVNNMEELQAALQKRAKSGDIGMDAILFLAEPLAVTPDAFAVMGKFAAEHKLPIGGALMLVEGYSSVFGVNIDPANTGKQAAVLADKILRGTPAGTIPVVSAESFFEINYKAAQELGLNVSEGLLSRADKVIR